MAPSLAGPTGPYVHAVAVHGGTLLFMSGIVARDASGVIATGDVGVQTRVILERARAVLTKAGGELADIIKMTVYLRDPNDYAVLNEVRREVLSEVQFSSTTVICDFPAKDALVEIEFVAQLLHSDLGSA